MRKGKCASFFCVYYFLRINVFLARFLIEFIFLSYLRFCHHLASAVICKLLHMILFPETTGSIGTKHGMHDCSLGGSLKKFGFFWGWPEIHKETGGQKRVLFVFNLLFWNHSASWYKTWYECSLDNPLKSCFFVDQKYTKETRGPNVSWINEGQKTWFFPQFVSKNSQ